MNTTQGKFNCIVLLLLWSEALWAWLPCAPLLVWLFTPLQWEYEEGTALLDLNGAFENHFTLH